MLSKSDDWNEAYASILRPSEAALLLRKQNSCNSHLAFLSAEITGGSALNTKKYRMETFYITVIDLPF